MRFSRCAGFGWFDVDVLPGVRRLLGYSAFRVMRTGQPLGFCRKACYVGSEYSKKNTSQQYSPSGKAKGEENQKQRGKNTAPRPGVFEKHDPKI